MNQEAHAAASTSSIQQVIEPTTSQTQANTQPNGNVGVTPSTNTNTPSPAAPSSTNTVASNVAIPVNPYSIGNDRREEIAAEASSKSTSSKKSQHGSAPVGVHPPTNAETGPELWIAICGSILLLALFARHSSHAIVRNE